MNSAPAWRTFSMYSKGLSTESDRCSGAISFASASASSMVGTRKAIELRWMAREAFLRRAGALSCSLTILTPSFASGADVVTSHTAALSSCSASQSRSAVTWAGLAPPSAMISSSLGPAIMRSEEHTSELQSLAYLVCRLLLEKKKIAAIQQNLLPPQRTELLPSLHCLHT